MKSLSTERDYSMRDIGGMLEKKQVFLSPIVDVLFATIKRNHQQWIEDRFTSPDGDNTAIWGCLP
jgi:hypothetical protein